VTIEMNDRHSSATPTSPGPNRKDALRRIRHDLRHALYVSDLALTLLADSRADENRFGEVLQMLRREQAAMQSLVDDLIMIASTDDPTAMNGEAAGGGEATRGHFKTVNERGTGTICS
jgi:hypothetical protein